MRPILAGIRIKINCLIGTYTVCMMTRVENPSRGGVQSPHNGLTVSIQTVDFQEVLRIAMLGAWDARIDFQNEPAIVISARFFPVDTLVRIATVYATCERVSVSAVNDRSVQANVVVAAGRNIFHCDSEMLSEEGGVQPVVDIDAVIVAIIDVVECAPHGEIRKVRIVDRIEVSAGVAGVVESHRIMGVRATWVAAITIFIQTVSTDFIPWFDRPNAVAKITPTALIRARTLGQSGHALPFANTARLPLRVARCAFSLIGAIAPGCPNASI